MSSSSRLIFFSADGCILFSKPDLAWYPLNGNYLDYTGKRGNLTAVRNEVIWKYFDAGVETGQYAWFDGSSVLVGPDPGSVGTFVRLFFLVLNLKLKFNFILGCLGLPCTSFTDICKNYQ